MSEGVRKAFYQSINWKRTRAAYRKSVGGLCERCKAKGLIVAGDIVHHKRYLTDDNLADPTIALDWDNLELLCMECHNREHTKDKRKRYRVDADGRVRAID